MVKLSREKAVEIIPSIAFIVVAGFMIWNGVRLIISIYNKPGGFVGYDGLSVIMLSVAMILFVGICLGLAVHIWKILHEQGVEITSVNRHGRRGDGW